LTSLPPAPALAALRRGQPHPCSCPSLYPTSPNTVPAATPCNPRTHPH
jgi:hypothetical protein